MNDSIKMGTLVCEVCGKEHSHGAGILIHKRMGNIEGTCTGYGLCEEHETLHKDGYIALIVASNPTGSAKTLKMREADRTGEIIHMKREAAEEMFKNNFEVERSFVFIDTELADRLKKLEAAIGE
jgi:hypothetical protein